MSTQRKCEFKTKEARLGKRTLGFVLASCFVLGLSGCTTADSMVAASDTNEESNYQLVCKVNYSDDGHSKTYYDYDEAGRIIRETERDKDGKLSDITETEYDDQGRTSLKAMESYYSDNDPSSTRTEYYTDGEITGSNTVYYRKGQIYKVDKSDHWKDEDGNEVDVWYTGDDEESLVEKSRRVTTISVDDDGTEHKVARNEQGEVEYSETTKKDDQGNILLHELTTSHSFKHSENEYENGKLTHCTEWWSDPSPDNDFTGHEERYYYDEGGNIVFREDLSEDCLPGDGCYCVYDDKGNLLQAATVSQGELSAIDTHIYDEHGNLLTEWTEGCNGGGTSVRKTYEYRNKDGSEYISGYEYDLKKYYAPYVDNHSYGEYLLMDIKDIYSTYGSGTLDEYFLSEHVQPDRPGGSPWEFDKDIDCTRTADNELVLDNEFYKVSLPAKWSNKIEVECEGPTWDTYDVYYVSSESKKPCQLMKIVCRMGEELEWEADDAGDIGFTRALSLNEKGPRIDIYAMTAYEFWYENATGNDDKTRGLSGEEKQEILDFLYDGQVTLDELYKSDESDMGKYLDFSKSDWFKSMTDSFEIVS